ncbi:MAG: tetratricopeptide repeat protein [Planctomycetota bacterium]|nr:tetratricopeptide repeat protein [Planctomycetota bacterium]
MARACGCALAVVLALVAASCEEKRKAPAPAKTGEATDSSVHAAAPVQKPPTKPTGAASLKELGPGRFEWHYASAPDAQDATLLVDNGYDESVTLFVDGAKAMTIDPLGKAWLQIPRGLFGLALKDGRDQVLSECSAPIFGTVTYVYNPGARWRYRIITAEYSTIPGLGGYGPAGQCVTGQVFFRPEDVDAYFDELPESITVTTYDNMPYATGTRRALHHVGETPVQVLDIKKLDAEDGKTFVLVQEGDAEYTLADQGDATIADATVYIDNELGREARFMVDGLELMALPAGALTTVRMQPEWCQLDVTDEDGEVLDGTKAKLSGGSRYVFNPQALASYAIDTEEYGVMPIQGGGGTDALRYIIGKKLFEVETDFCFEPFPAAVDMGQGQWSVTKTRLTKDTTKRPKVSPDSGIPEMKSHIEAGEFIEAEELGIALLQTDPGCAEGFYLLGVAYAGSGSDTAAGEAFSRAIELDPKYVDAYKARMRLTMKTGIEPVSDFEAILKINPTDDETLTLRGDMRAEKGYLDEALDCYNTAIRANPSNVGALTGRAAVFAKQGKPKLALNDLAQAVKCDPGCVLARLARARILMEQKRDASEDTKAAVELAPDDADANLLRAQWLMSQGEHGEAVRYFDKYFDLIGPLGIATTETYAACGEAHFKCGDYSEALRYLNEAVNCDPDLAPRLQEMINKCKAESEE